MDRKMTYEVYCRVCNWTSGQLADIVDAEKKFDLHEAETGHRHCGRDRFLKCRCGNELLLDSFTNECSCGIEYNTSGQQLAPRNQWDADTDDCNDDY
jgi:hypothetical protein